MLFISLLLILVLSFCFVGIFLGAPYMPTLNKQVEIALELAELKKGDTLLELGCGDGRVLIAAAKKDIKAIGYEINPFLVLICDLRTIKYRQLVQIKWGNYWDKSWPAADIVFVFLISRYMEKLDKRLNNYPYKPIKLISFAFKIKGKRITKSKNGLFLYIYK